MPAVIAVFFVFILWNFVKFFWPILLAVAAVAAIYFTARAIDNRLNNAAARERRRQKEIAERADRQHRQMMSGQWVEGTYGDHMPPKGLRKIGYLRDLK